MNNNTFPRESSTLPPESNTADVVQGQKKRTTSDPQYWSAPEPYQSIPAQELLKDNCGKCGWIRKEGGSIKTWRDRYVILHKGCLYYYHKPEATTTAGKFSLCGYRLSPAPEKSMKYAWTFKLVHLQPEKRTYYFAAYSEREMNEWMENLTKEMEENCGALKPIIPESTEFAEGAEYCYPEVEPRYDPDEIAVLFGGKPSPNLPRKPETPPMYCPAPEFVPRDVAKKPPLLPRPGAAGVHKGSEWPKGCSISNIGAVRPLPNVHSWSPVKPFPGSSCVLPPNLASRSPVIPSRPIKPTTTESSLSPPLKPRPKPLPRPPPLKKHTTGQIENYGIDSEGRDDDECSEGYLEFVPDTAPPNEDCKGTKDTLSRGYPDGNSFRRRQNRSEDALPSSASVVDMDKNEVARLLENKVGHYVLRKTESAQSKRALSVWTGDRVRHYLIFYEEEKGYTLDPKEGAVYFEKMERLLWHYHNNDLPNCDVKLIRQSK